MGSSRRNTGFLRQCHGDPGALTRPPDRLSSAISDRHARQHQRFFAGALVFADHAPKRGGEDAALTHQIAHRQSFRYGRTLLQAADTLRQFPGRQDPAYESAVRQRCRPLATAGRPRRARQVDLPLPFGPNRAVNAPAGKAKLEFIDDEGAPIARLRGPRHASLCRHVFNGMATPPEQIAEEGRADERRHQPGGKLYRRQYGAADEIRGEHEGRADQRGHGNEPRDAAGRPDGGPDAARWRPTKPIVPAAATAAPERCAHMRIAHAPGKIDTQAETARGMVAEAHQIQLANARHDEQRRADEPEAERSDDGPVGMVDAAGEPDQRTLDVPDFSEGAVTSVVAAPASAPRPMPMKMIRSDEVPSRHDRT